MKIYLLERLLWGIFRRYPTRKGRDLRKSNNSKYDKKTVGLGREFGKENNLL